MAKPWKDMTPRERQGRKGQRWERKRQAVFARDGDICWLCGRVGADSIDHVVQLADGGGNDLDNLRPAHMRPQPWGCPGNVYRRKPARVVPTTSREW